MKRLIALVLSLILICSLIPFSAFAEEITDPDQVEDVKPEDENKDDETEEKKELDKKKVDHFALGEDHTFGWDYNLRYHWLACSCGCQLGMEPHVDPLTAEDDTCTCGYRFSDNADLVVLWIGGAYHIKNFNKNITEYKIKAHTYKDFEEVKIVARPFQAGATIEYPEDLTLNEGENVYEIKVTSENKKVTKIYKVTVVKESD